MINAGAFQRGETVSLLVAPYIGVQGDVTGLPTANLKPAIAGRASVPGDDVTAATAFSVAASAASGAVPAGWTITLSAAQTLALSPGAYVTDVRCVVAGGIVISEPCTLQLVNAVTPS